MRPPCACGNPTMTGVKRCAKCDVERALAGWRYLSPTARQTMRERRVWGVMAVVILAGVYGGG